MGVQSIVKMASDKVENVSFKVSLLENEKSLEKLEVRRFVVPQDCSTSLVYLKEKIRNIFNLGRSDCKVFWIDEDNDHVAIETDEELVIALQELNGPVYKLQVVKRNLVEIDPDDNDNSAKNVSGEVHPGVVCDGCDGQVKGFRYVAMETMRIQDQAFGTQDPKVVGQNGEGLKRLNRQGLKWLRKTEMKKEEKKSSNTNSADPWQIPEGGMPQIPPMTFELQDQGGNVLHSGDLGNLNQLSGLVGMANHFNQHFGEHFGTPMTPMAPTPNLAKDLAVLNQVLRANHQEKKEDDKKEKPSNNLNEQINKMWASAEEPKESKKDEVREIKIQKENPISCHICQAPFPS